MNVMSSALGALLGVGVLVMIIVLIIMGAVNDDGKRVTEVEPHSALWVSFNSPVIERGLEKQMDLGPFGNTEGFGLNHVIEDIKKAETDENIEGIFLDMLTISGSPSTLLDIRRALEEFKETGKWIIAYDENYTQADMFLASLADEIYVYPEGNVDWRGISAELMYFKNMLEKLEVDMQVLRGPDNKYKSAVEPFMYDKMTEPNREQMAALIDNIWGVMCEKVGESRGISVQTLNEMADSLSITLPRHAVEQGLVDALAYRDEVIDIIAEKIGTSTEDDDDDLPNTTLEDRLNLVGIGNYHFAQVGDAPNPSDELKKKKIAVVYAVGAIESGEGDDQTIGSDRIAKALRIAREDEDVSAVVLRVNSPGGSALASDVIWRETQLIKESGRPFVVSMGDVAASGGYYISCAADKIYANENTITGSIGVFGMLPNAQALFNNKLGITFDRVNSNANSDVISGFKPLTEMQHTAIDDVVSEIYYQFIEIVAEGRNMNVADVDSVARGRVWSGEDALQIGLVDELGSLQDAIAGAAELAEMEDYRVKELPIQADPFEQLIKELSGQASIDVVEQTIGNEFGILDHLEKLKLLASLEGVQARMPFFFELR